MEISKAVAALSAVAQESRLELFRLLVKIAPESLTAGALAEELQIPPATLSFHLKELARAGLVESVREGRSIHYSIDICGVNRLISFLTEDCCQGRPELCESRECKTPRKKRRSKIKT